MAERKPLGDIARELDALSLLCSIGPEAKELMKIERVKEITEAAAKEVRRLRAEGAVVEERLGIALEEEFGNAD